VRSADSWPDGNHLTGNITSRNDGELYTGEATAHQQVEMVHTGGTDPYQHLAWSRLWVGQLLVG
jgi:hypothetical protein